MGTTLTGTRISDTYDSLLKATDNGIITSSAKQITDGVGNNTPLYISTSRIGIGVSPTTVFQVSGNSKIGGDLTVTGNLLVEGTTTTVDTDTLSVKDPLIIVGNDNNTSDLVDLGFYGLYDTSGSQDLYAGLYRSASTTKFHLFKDLQEEPTTTVNTSGTGYAVATLIANLEGNVTGNLIGNVTGGTFTGTLLSNVVATTQSAGDNSTKVATTAYVDSGLAGQDTLAEVLANGNTTGGTDISVSVGDDIVFGSTSKAIYSNALEIYRDGNDAYLKALNGSLSLINNDNGTEKTVIKVNSNTAELYNNDSKKLETTSTGIEVTGTGTFSDNVSIYTDKKLYFNSTSNLSLYHNNSTNGSIIENSQGDLTIQGIGLSDDVNIKSADDVKIFVNGTDQAIDANASGGVELYYNNAKKLETTSTGVSVTDNIIVSGTVDGRDVATDGIKLDGIEAGADVTDATNVLAAGAVMTTGNQSIAGEKTFSSFTSTGIDDNATSTALTIDNTNRAFFSGDVSLQANLIGNTNATGDLTVLGSLFVGDYGVNDDPDYLYADNNIFRIGYYSNAKQFEVNNSDFKVTATHKIGIGTNDPQTLLEVSNENSGLDPVIRLNNVDSSLSDGQNLGSIEFYNDHTNNTTGNIGMFYSTDGTIAKEMRFNFGSPYGDIFKINVNEINAIKRFTITGSGTTPRVTLVNNVGEAGLTYSLRSQDSGDFGIFQGSSDVLTIDSNGDVGIGTDEPHTKLHLQDEDNALFFTLESSNTTTHKNIAIKYQNYSTGTDFWWTGMNGAGDNMNNFVFNYSQNFDNTILTLEPTGNVGINETDPETKLDISGDHVGSIGLLRLNSSASNISAQTYYINDAYQAATYASTSNEFIIWGRSGDITFNTTTTNQERMRIDSSGNVLLGAGTGNPYLAFLSAGGNGGNERARIFGYADGGTYGGGLEIQTRDSSNIFQNRINIDSSGNVGINETSPDALLDIEMTDTNTYDANALNTATLIAQTFNTSNVNSQASIISLRTTGWAGGTTGIVNIGAVQAGNANSADFVIQTRNAGTYGERMRIDSSGNVGIGVVPNAVTAGNIRLDVGYPGCGITSRQNAELVLTSNADYATATTTGRNAIMVNLQNDGNFSISNAPSNTAGQPLTFTPRFYINTSGNVGIGTDSPDTKLEVDGKTIYPIIKISASSNTTRAMSLGMSDAISHFIDAGGSSSNLILKTVGSERMRITSGGDVELKPSTSRIKGGGTTSGKLELLNSDSTSYIVVNGSANASAHEIAFVTNSALAAKITSGGNLLVGATSTVYTEKFSIQNSTASQGMVINQTDNSNANDKIIFRNTNGVVGYIRTTGSATSYVTSSDYRLKENVKKMTGALDRVSQLKPSRFNFIADVDKTVDGFLAHEVQEVVPEAISGEKDAMRTEEYEISPDVYEDVIHPAEEAVYETIEHPAVEEELDDEGNVIVEGKEAYTEEVLVTEAKEEWTEKVLVTEKVMGTREVPDYQGIDQSKLVPLLVGAIQELKAEIESLKLQINN